MSDLVTIYQGQSEKIQITFKDSDGNLLVYANLVDARVVFSQNAVPFAQFSKVANDLYTPLIADSNDVNSAFAILSESMTKSMPCGEIVVEVFTTRYDTDAGTNLTRATSIKAIKILPTGGQFV